MAVEARAEQNLEDDFDEDDEPLVFKRSCSSKKQNQSNAEMKKSSSEKQVHQSTPEARSQNGQNTVSQKGKIVNSSKSPPFKSPLASPKLSNSSGNVSPVKSPVVNSKPSTSELDEPESVKQRIKEEKRSTEAIFKHEDLEDSNSDDDDDDDVPLSARAQARSSEINSNNGKKGPNISNLGQKPMVKTDDSDDDDIPLSSRFNGKSNSDEKEPLILINKQNLSASTGAKPSNITKKRPAEGVKSVTQSSSKKPKLIDLTLHTYNPHGLKMLYKGKPVDLTPEQEEVATMYAVMLETDYMNKPQFKENFMADWRKILGKNHTIQSLEHCDFTPIYEWHQKEKEKKKQISTEEKPENTIIPITSSQPEVKTTTGTQSSSGVSTSAMDRAVEVQANLSPQFPSFVKLMLKSHVSGGFWLGLPKQFCVLHLPNHDADVVLVDEDGKEREIKYLVNKNGLSGGWRGFSIAKKLREGDVVIFQLVEPCKLKVYIIRAKTLTELDGTVSLLNLDSHAKPMDTDQPEGNGYIRTDNQKYEEPLMLDSCNIKNTLTLISDYDPAMDKCDTHFDHWSDMHSDSETLEGMRFSESVVYFKDVKKFDDFTIQVDALVLDSKIPTHLRRKYYEICCSRNMFLHENLIEGLNCDLATGVISETINIADAIREVKTAKKSVSHLESWDRTLKAFEDLGMAVGFLRDRIRKLVSLYRESQAVIESKRSERDEAENEMKCLKEKLRGTEALVKLLDLEINDLVVGNEELDSVFMEVAGASW